MPRHLISDGPIYTHDCPRCTYVGSSVFTMTGETTHSNGVDMYVHLNPGGAHTYIRRFSSNPADYSSFRPSDWAKDSNMPTTCRLVVTLARSKGIIS